MIGYMADADCHYGDHFYSGRGVVCTNCGFRNMALLAYYSSRAREAKKRGMTVTEFEEWCNEQAMDAALPDPNEGKPNG